MAKKNLKYYIPGAIALVFGIAAFCMMFLEAVKYTADLLITETSYSYTGMQIAFGYKETMGSGALSTAFLLAESKPPVRPSMYCRIFFLRFWALW